MNRAALVTGGAGFIGSNLVRALLEAGWAVRVLDDGSTGRSANLVDVSNDIEWVRGDVRDPVAVRDAVAGRDVVFHEAAIPSVARSVADPAASNDVNVGGTLNVLIAARDSGVGRMVYASSAAVYGSADAPPLAESMPTRPLSPYGVSKLAGERYAEAFTRTWGLPTVSLRYLNVYGPRQDPASEYASAVPRFIARTIAGEPPTIFGDGEQSRDFVSVDDVVRANLLAAAAPEAAWGRAVNVGTGVRRTVNELLATIRAAIPGEHPAPSHGPPRPGEVRDSWCDPSLGEELLGFRAEVPFDDGIRRTIDWVTERESPAAG